MFWKGSWGKFILASILFNCVLLAFVLKSFNEVPNNGSSVISLKKSDVALPIDPLNIIEANENHNDQFNGHFVNNRKLLSLSSPTKRLVITDAEKKQWFDNHLFVFDGLKTGFCVIESNACTMFKQIFKRIKGATDYLSNDPSVIHLPYKGLEDISFNNMEKLISFMNAEDFYFAAFVRDPLERLVSAYINKCENKQTDLCNYAKYSGQFREQYNIKITQDKLSSVPSFVHWVDGLTQCPCWPDVDNQIAPQNLFCNLYQYADKYDVFRFENRTHRQIWMKQAKLWDKFGSQGWKSANNDVSIVNYDPIQSNTNAGVNDEIFLKYWKENAVILARAIDAYRNDYIIFGMQMPAWLCDPSIEKIDILKRAIRAVPRTLRPPCENLPWLIIPP